MKWINIHIILSVWVIFFAEIGYAEDQKPILDADSYISMGIDNVVKGQYKQALSDFNKALEINPNYAGAYYNRGLVNVILEQKEQAISDFSKAIEINPNDAEAYYNRGNVFGDMGNLDKARICCSAFSRSFISIASRAFIRVSSSVWLARLFSLCFRLKNSNSYK